MEQLSTKLITIIDAAVKFSLLTVKGRILYNIYEYYKVSKLDSLAKQRLTNEVYTPIRTLNRSIAECINAHKIINNFTKIHLNYK